MTVIYVGVGGSLATYVVEPEQGTVGNSSVWRAQVHFVDDGSVPRESVGSSKLVEEVAVRVTGYEDEFVGRIDDAWREVEGDICGSSGYNNLRKRVLYFNQPPSWMMTSERITIVRPGRGYYKLTS